VREPSRLGSAQAEVALLTALRWIARAELPAQAQVPELSALVAMESLLALPK
jgi:hypothetical protein